jgi:hypothetical protein
MGTIEILPNIDYYFRFVQTLGGTAFKMWLANEPEISGVLSFSYQLTLADYGNPNGSDHVEIVLPTVHWMNVNNMVLGAIKVGGAFNRGAWGHEQPDGIDGFKGEFCNVGDGLTRYGFCSPATNIVTRTSTQVPQVEFSFAFVIVVGPGNNLPGRLLSYDEHIVAWDVKAHGHPPIVHIEGLLETTHYPDIASLTVDFVTYHNINQAYDPAFYGNSGFLAPHSTVGSVVVSPTSSTDNSLTAFSIDLPANNLDTLYWGLKIGGLEGLVGNLPFRGAGFLFPPNHNITVKIKNLEVSATGIAFCTARDYCDLCENQRCFDVIDNFNSNTVVAASDIIYTRDVTYGIPVTIDQGAGTTITYSGNEALFSFDSQQNYISTNYSGAFGCFTGQPTEIGQVTVDFKIPVFGTDSGELNIYTDSNFYLSYQVYDNVAYGSVYTGTNTTLPTIAPDVWYSMKMQGTGDGIVRLKIWPSDSAEPIGWLVENTITNGYVLGQIYIEAGPYDASGTFQVGIRNLNISSIGSSGAGDGVLPVPETPPTENPPPPPTDTPGYTLPIEAIEGYGSLAVTSFASQVDYHVTTLSPTGAGSLMDGLSADNRHIIFDVSGTIDLGPTPQTVNNRHNFTINGDGYITLVGTLNITNSDYFVIKNFRHEGGLDECFTISACHDFAIQHVSMSLFGVRAMTISGGSYNWTKQSCLTGYGATNSTRGALTLSGPGTEIRNGYIGVQYDTPFFKGSTCRVDVVNSYISGRFAPVKTYGISIAEGARLNVINSYFQEEDEPINRLDFSSILWHEGCITIFGATDFLGTTYNIGRETTAAFAITSELSAADAARYVKNYAGCLPRNNFDTSLVQTIIV